MVKKKFIRSKWRTMSKLGKRRKKKQVWRKPKGRDTQMRLQKKGNPRIVKIGYKKQKKEKEIKVIKNIRELLKLRKGEKIILGKVGKKKKLEMIKKAQAHEIKILNLNIKKFLKKVEREKKIREELKKKQAEKEKGKKEKKTREEKKETLEEKTKQEEKKQEEKK